MQRSRETRILNFICVMLVLLAGAVRLLGYYYGTFSYNSIIFMFFTASAFIWIYQLQRTCPAGCSKESDGVRSYDDFLDDAEDDKI